MFNGHYTKRGYIMKYRNQQHAEIMSEGWDIEYREMLREEVRFIKAVSSCWKESIYNSWLLWTFLNFSVLNNIKINIANYNQISNNINRISEELMDLETFRDHYYNCCKWIHFSTTHRTQTNGKRLYPWTLVIFTRNWNWGRDSPSTTNSIYW